MNETRKAIIELIGDYMEKELSFGCWIETGIVGGGYGIDNIYTQIVRKQCIEGEAYTVSGNPYCTVYVKNIHFAKDKSMINKILGHYDISAVLKYINQYTDYQNAGDAGGILIGDRDDMDGGHWKEYGMISSKPLHLYTEQEEKDLLELLTKLTHE